MRCAVSYTGADKQYLHVGNVRTQQRYAARGGLHVGLDDSRECHELLS